MRLLFDGTATQGKTIPFHGGADYAIYVFECALKAGYNFDILLFKGLVTNPRVITGIQEYKLNVIEIESMDEIYSYLNSDKYDRFFSALPQQQKKYSMPSVVVIHGLRGVEMPWDEYYYKYQKSLYKKIAYWLISNNRWTWKYVKQMHLKNFNNRVHNTNRVITVSTHSKYSIKYYFPDIDLEDITVIPSPARIAKFDAGNNQYGKYFLMVSGKVPIKNIYRGIKAFNKLFDMGLLTDVNVVITGCANVPFANNIKNRGKFVLLDYVSNPELENLYANAYGFVYPSLNEGYGYPPVFAMANDVPVVASSLSSISEVCQDAALYFNPYDVDNIANRILQIYSDEGIRKRLIDNGRKVSNKIINEQKDNVDHLLKIIFEDRL